MMFDKDVFHIKILMGFFVCWSYLLNQNNLLRYYIGQFLYIHLTHDDQGETFCGNSNHASFPASVSDVVGLLLRFNREIL